MRKLLKHPLAPVLAFWVILICAFDLEARKYDLYWIFPHIDKVLHVIGGIALGTFAWMLADCFWSHVSSWKRFWIVIGIAFAGGLVVEIFEFLQQVFHFVPYPFDAWDTVGDLLCDTLGGVISFLYYYYLG